MKRLIYTIIISLLVPLSLFGEITPIGTVNIYQMGDASWYGEEDHGNLTANGEVYDSFDFSAAHKTLTFGTIVKVTHVYNGKQVTVRINDRGPFIGDRIIDLSYGAAEEIDMIQEGVAPVLLEIMYAPDKPESLYNRVEDANFVHMQLGAFSTEERAKNFIHPLETKNTYPYTPVIEEDTDGLFHVSLYNIAQKDLEPFTLFVTSIGYKDIFVYVPTETVNE